MAHGPGNRERRRPVRIGSAHAVWPWPAPIPVAVAWLMRMAVRVAGVSRYVHGRGRGLVCPGAGLLWDSFRVSHAGNGHGRLRKPA